MNITYLILEKKVKPDRYVNIQPSDIMDLKKLSMKYNAKKWADT